MGKESFWASSEPMNYFSDAHQYEFYHLSRKLSGALRHSADRRRLCMSHDDWALLEEVRRSLRPHPSVVEIRKTVATSIKEDGRPRFEIRERAGDLDD